MGYVMSVCQVLSYLFFFDVVVVHLNLVICD